MPTAPYQEFAGRLHKALDRARFPADRARTGALANRYAVTRETARKWLAGLALPELERMITLATDFRVAFEWLATGRGTPDVDAGKVVREITATYGDDTLQKLHAWLDTLTDEQRKGLIQFLGIC
ncbi:DNA-binding protein [Pseudoxanthomonas sp. LjRoot168]|uniref:helix-turn-helix domain-containing protein n=1 Tax=unclassified Pseudoxanthomonas TaxID=2645906 RepID=UPI003ECCB17A